ncbi:hypothetical protein COX95_01080 [bacterium CG_4_10_14_0_2_um_filter_33_32]|nr:MAG: hypothetical protein COZ97_03240 [bacterium CG_4_8_14_3_um_filter_33_28]PIY84905.1 MAG: hypothetical protein COY76_04860 [bacterium CG_4_10_14_0_8_um_filter_33_57]PIZ86494.1 MAG: hypothetical protein COX95_01080 [bacterium CG_4_10_14_0_2_um_filter_33_32]PJA72413.1 MAG: hypothetical protein CO152_01590 [bacterium CG_4_9_14_3_um_filter_33_26]
MSKIFLNLFFCPHFEKAVFCFLLFALNAAISKKRSENLRVSNGLDSYQDENLPTRTKRVITSLCEGGFFLEIVQIWKLET